MFGYDSKLKLKELLLFIADQELAIEKMRQILASIRDFEPYAAFKRLDRNGTGFLDAKELCQFERENGYREISPEDFIFFINYFDLDGDAKLNYHDFLQVLLPCDNPFLRSAATQRPNQELYPNEFLPMRVERAMSQLIYKEVKLHLKAENIKRSLESSYDFSVRAAFKAIDDWNYQYIDKQNLKRFLRSMGHLASKAEIVAILRRLDLDGDAKINLQEFGEAIKTQLASSRPVRLRNQELSQERKRSASAVKRSNRSISRKRSDSQIGSTPQQKRASRGEQLYGQPPSILKSAQSTKKRPKTAERVSSGYKPNRGVNGGKRKEVMNPEASQGLSGMASSGLNFTPYQVPNVALIPGVSQNELSNKKQVSFNNGQSRANQGSLPEKLPSSLSAGLGYLREQKNDQRANHSPLRQSPRRDDPPQQSLYAQPQQDIGYTDQQKFESRGLRNASPLRSQSPRRSARKSARKNQGSTYESGGFVAERPATNAGMNFGTFDRIEQQEFAKILKDNIFLERELEGAKIEAALKPDFNLLDAFKIFDTRGAGNVSVQDVIMALRESIGFTEFTHDDVYLLFRRNDTNNDGKLNFQEFGNVLLPVAKEYAALLTDRPDFYMSRGVPLSQFFNHDTRSELRALWAALFKCERACEVLRVTLRQRPYFNIKQAFSFMDRDCDGWVDLDDIREFLANTGFYATERELQGIMTKCDTNNNGSISFAEFVDEFSPKLGK